MMHQFLGKSKNAYRYYTLMFLKSTILTSSKSIKISTVLFRNEENGKMHHLLQMFKIILKMKWF